MVKEKQAATSRQVAQSPTRWEFQHLSHRLLRDYVALFIEEFVDIDFLVVAVVLVRVFHRDLTERLILGDGLAQFGNFAQVHLVDTLKAQVAGCLDEVLHAESCFVFGIDEPDKLLQLSTLVIPGHNYESETCPRNIIRRRETVGRTHTPGEVAPIVNIRRGHSVLSFLSFRPLAVVLLHLLPPFAVYSLLRG